MVGTYIGSVERGLGNDGPFSRFGLRVSSDKVCILDFPTLGQMLCGFRSNPKDILLANLYRHMMCFVSGSVIETKIKRFRYKISSTQKVVSEDVLDPQTEVIILGGDGFDNIPSKTCYDFLSMFIDKRNLYCDGSDVEYTHRRNRDFPSVRKRIFFITEPFSDTGNTMDSNLDICRKKYGLTDSDLIVPIHLLISRRYIEMMTEKHTNLKMFILRVDNGVRVSVV